MILNQSSGWSENDQRMLQNNRDHSVIILYYSPTSFSDSATHCNTFRHTATHCDTLQHIAAHCNTLRHTAKHCTARHFMCGLTHLYVWHGSFSVWLWWFPIWLWIFSITPRRRRSNQPRTHARRRWTSSRQHTTVCSSLWPMFDFASPIYNLRCVHLCVCVREGVQLSARARARETYIYIYIAFARALASARARVRESRGGFHDPIISLSLIIHYLMISLFLYIFISWSHDLMIPWSHDPIISWSHDPMIPLFHWFHVTLCIAQCVCALMYACVWARVCMFMYVCLCVRMCVCVWVRVCGIGGNAGDRGSQGGGLQYLVRLEA